MLPSDIRNLQEAYENIYEESDILTDDLIEEIVEELVEECLEFGYDLDESVAAVEEAAILYMDEAKVTYGSDTESPEQRRERAKAKVGEKKSAARQAAVKSAVSKVRSKAAGAAISAYAAGKAAKSAVSGAVSAAKKAPAAVSAAAKQKKAEVKSGVKSLIGRGLRKAAGAVGKVAQRAAGAASRLGEETKEYYKPDKSKVLKLSWERRKSANAKAVEDMKNTDAYKSMAATAAKKFDEEVEYIEERDEGKPGLMFKKIAKDAAKRYGSEAAGNRVAGAIRKKVLAKEEFEIYDVVLEYLMSEGHADTIAEAEYIMTELDTKMVNQIIETRMDPRGRPASGPMNVYAKSKPNTDPAFQAALAKVRADDAKKTPEQRKAELDAYRARKENS